MDASLVNEPSRFVKTHRVWYELRSTFSIFAISDGLVGFQLALYGIHDSGSHVNAGDCPQCRRVWEGLHQIGAAVVSAVEGSECCHTLPFLQGAFSPLRQRGPEVEMIMEVFYGSDGRPRKDSAAWQSCMARLQACAIEPVPADRSFSPPAERHS